MKYKYIFTDNEALNINLFMKTFLSEIWLFHHSLLEGYNKSSLEFMTTYTPKESLDIFTCCSILYS